MALALLLLVLAAEPAKELRILTDGQFHGSEVKDPGTGWLKLSDDLKRLVPVTLEVKKIRDEVLDDGKPASVKTGVEISSGPLPELFYVKGLEPGPVKAAQLERRRYLADGKPVKAGEGALQLVTTGKLQQLVFTLGTKKQVLYEQTDGDVADWELRFAGDLDGDGRMDLVVYANGDSHVKTLRLFLSSRAKDGELLHEAALFSTTGC